MKEAGPYEEISCHPFIARPPPWTPVFLTPSRCILFELIFPTIYQSLIRPIFTDFLYIFNTIPTVVNMKTFAALAALGAAVAPALAGIIPRDQGSLPPVTVKGNAFFAGNDRFYIRGVAYQPGM